jgi:hypothetical protein
VSHFFFLGLNQMLEEYVETRMHWFALKMLLEKTVS